MYDFSNVNKLIESVKSSQNKTGQLTEKLKVGVDLGTAYIVIVVLDENNNPVACEKKFCRVLKDGVVVDYIGALNVVRELKETIEKKINRELLDCAIAMPAGTDSSIKTHTYVVEGAGFNVINVVDEPSAANSIYNINDGVIIDIGGGTTGIAVLKDKKVVHIADEPTGGTHISLVLSGNYKISLDEAERIKMDYKRHKEILPIVSPVVEKMAAIVKNNTGGYKYEAVFLTGGTCCLTGIETIFAKVLEVPVYKPENPFFVTPTGIAKNCNI